MFAVRRLLLHSLVFAQVGSGTLLAAKLEDQSEFQAAHQALSDGLPGVAALKAERLLKDKTWESEDRQRLVALAVEAWVRAQDGRAALSLLDQESVPHSAFWRAQALMQMQEPVQAEKLLLSRLTEGTATDAERLLLAQVSLAINNIPQAQETLKSLHNTSDSFTARQARLLLGELDLQDGNYDSVLQNLQNATDPTAKVLQARAWIGMGRYADAEALLRNLLASPAGGAQVHHAAAVQLAEALLRQQNLSAATESLVQFLDHTPESRLWGEAFHLLAQILQAQPDAPPPDAALRWASEGNVEHKKMLPPPAAADTFRSHAMLLLARWLLAQKRSTEALGLLEVLIQTHADQPQGDEAMRLALETYSDAKADARVTALASQWRKRPGGGGALLVDFVSAAAAYARGEAAQAAALFQDAAEIAATLSERRSSLYNAAVAALRAGELALYQTLLGQLKVVSAGAANPSQDAAADLELDRALEMAARAQPGAETELLVFIRSYPKHPRLAEALLARAELALLKSPPDIKSANNALAAAEPLQTSDAMRQRLAFTRMWSLDRQGDLAGLIEAGTDFLKTWPDAANAPEVRMKMADAYFRQENFASARTEFELVAKEYPGTAYADTATYFAALSALSLIGDENREIALDLWQELAERGGPLGIAARQQQALVKRRAGQEEEALKLLDALLAEKSLSHDLRRSLLCEKAETLIALGKAKPEHTHQAVELLHTLLREDHLTYLWSARAGYTLAFALKDIGKNVEALEACYDVVQAKGFTGPTNPAEFRWFFRAGFLGIELLEKSSQWEAAARLAEKLAQSNGDLAADARERATDIRLKHFLWDDKKP